MAKINKRQLLEALKTDLVAAEELKNINDGKILKRRNTFNAVPYGNEEEGKSKIVPKVAKRQSEWAHASLKDPFVSTPDIIKCNPVTYEDVNAARQNEILLNTQFCRQFDRYSFMTKAIKVLDVDATLVVQVGWETEDEERQVKSEVVKTDEYGREYIATEMVTETVTKVNRPTAKVCRSEDVYIDPTCQDDFDNAQFIIYRYETDLSTLKKDGRYSNLDRIVDVTKEDDGYYASADNTDFRFQDKPRKKLVVYEYWGNYDIDDDGEVEAIVCAWVGNTVIRLGTNPYPDKKPPFLVVPYSSVPFQIYGENNMDLIADNQKVITALTRGFINNMAASTNGQVGLKKGTLDPTQRKKFFAGKNFEYNTSANDIWQGHYNQIPATAFNMLELQNNEVESLTGTKGFSGGISGNALGSNSATAARGVLDATSVRRLDLVRNIAENLIKPLMRKWMVYNSEFLSDEQVVRITNEQFTPIRRDDLKGDIDIDIEISTTEDNANKSQTLGFLLQTLGNSVPFELTQTVLAQIARLDKQPKLEKDIKDFKPQPDKVQEQIKQLEVQKLQMEIEEIKARTANFYASAKENAGDEAEKFQKAKKLEAETTKLYADAALTSSKKDNEDLNYLKNDEQIDVANRRVEQLVAHQQELEKANQARMINLEAMHYQQKAGDKNIGVVENG